MSRFEIATKFGLIWLDLEQLEFLHVFEGKRK